MSLNLFKSLEFFFVLPFFLIFLNLLKLNDSVFKVGVTLISVLLLYCLPFIKLGYIIFLLSFLGFTYVALKMFQSSIQGKTSKNKKSVFLSFFSWFLIFSFIILKLSFWRQWDAFSFLNEWLADSILPAVGFAYFVIKVYSLFVDIKGGRANVTSFFDYLNYFLFFPIVLAGPIMRWKSWETQFQESRKANGLFLDWRTGVPRFIWGCFKTFTLAPLLKPFILASLETKQYSDPEVVYIGLVSYYFYEYINFSGYSDLAISTGKLLGMKLPENFNNPYLGHGLTGLWRRWHITLAHWLRDYIFYPLSFSLSSRVKKRTKFKSCLVNACSIFLTFVFCGIWHGDSYGLLFFGISSGLVMGSEVFIENYLGPTYRKITSGNVFIEGGSSLFLKILTFHVACVSFGPVLLSNDQFLSFFKNLLN